MSGRNQRMAPTDRMGGDDMKAKGFEGPHYRVTDQDWKMCKSPSRRSPRRAVSPLFIVRADIQQADFPDPLLPRPDLSTSLPPDMTRETERGFYAYLQICKDKAREADERKAAEKKAAAKRITE